MSASPRSGNFELSKDEEMGDKEEKVQAEHDSGEQISAADYDPSLDRREDEQRRTLGAQNYHTNDAEIVEEEEVEEVDEDEDVDDMFAALTGERKVKKVKRVVVSIISPFRCLDDSCYICRKR